MKKCLLFISLISLILLGCSKQEQENELSEIGPYFALDTETHTFYPHDDIYNLVFKNQYDEERTLVVQESEVDTVWNYSNNGKYIAHSSQFRRLRLVWDQDDYDSSCQFLIDMRVTVPDVAPHDLIDFMNITYSSLITEPEIKSAATKLDILTSNRGNVGIGYENFYSNEQPEFQEEIVIANETFSNVYIGTHISSDLNLYYSKENGILAFDDLEGNIWLFSHLE